MEAAPGGKTILIVEDIETIREPMACFFRDQGYAVLEAGRGDEALALIEKECPDIMFLDLGLPDMAGEDVLLAARRRLPGLRTVVITAETSRSRAAVCRICGVLDYLMKPVDFGYLVRLVTKTLSPQPA